MPQYEYQCPGCGWEGTRIVKMDERDKQVCLRNLGTQQEYLDFIHGENSTADEENHDPRCRANLERIEIPSSIATDTKGSHQTKAILSDGTKVAGHFGRSARKTGARYKP